MDPLPSYWPNSTEIRHWSHGFVFIFFSPGSAAIETSLDTVILFAENVTVNDGHMNVGLSISNKGAHASDTLFLRMKNF